MYKRSKVRQKHLKNERFVVEQTLHSKIITDFKSMIRIQVSADRRNVLGFPMEKVVEKEIVA